MLTEETMSKLQTMGLGGMASAMRRWLDQGDREGIAPTDLVGLLADAEWIDRENRRLANRLRTAKFREAACVEDIDYRPARGVSKTAVLDLSTCRWIAAHEALVVTGATGTGKTYLACALGQKACRDGFSVIYTRAARLYDDLYQAKGDGSYRRMLARLAKARLLIIDDFGLEPLDADARRNLLEVLEDRYGVSSTLITSQLDPKNWHPVIGDETIADAICDRLVHNAQRLRLGGESMRKTKAAAATAASPRKR